MIGKSHGYKPIIISYSHYMGPLILETMLFGILRYQIRHFKSQWSLNRLAGAEKANPYLQCVPVSVKSTSVLSKAEGARYNLPSRWLSDNTDMLRSQHCSLLQELDIGQ